MLIKDLKYYNRIHFINYRFSFDDLFGQLLKAGYYNEQVKDMILFNYSLSPISEKKKIYNTQVIKEIKKEIARLEK